MKAGTAQKMVLNMLSSGAMARVGYIYGNLMVNVHCKNQKLAERALTILERGAGVDRIAAQRLLKSGGNSVPVALIMKKAKVGRSDAARALKKTTGNVRQAIAQARRGRV
jgi:N-acetylmuramic acid 6-phosphate etherase